MAADVAKLRREAFLAWMADNDLNPNQIATASGVPYNTIRDYVIGATQSFKGDAEAKIARAYGLNVELIFGYGVMPEHRPAPNHLRAWRERTELTIEQVAAALTTDKHRVAPALITHLESGEYDVPDKWYRALAPIYGTTAGFLMDYDPENLPSETIRLVRMDPETQRRLVRAADALGLPTGTEG